MLPIVRPYEFSIIECILDGAGEVDLAVMEEKLKKQTVHYSQQMFEHALTYMCKTDFFGQWLGKLRFNNIDITVELDEYLRDLVAYGLGRYDVEFYSSETNEEKVFKLWSKYKKYQVQQLLGNNPKDIMKGTKVYNGTAYAYVTIVKSENTKDALKYVDGYIDRHTFQWETVANITSKELSDLRNSKYMELFVRKVDSEDGIQLPFTYLGAGKMRYVEGSRKENGAHLFNILLEAEAPEDLSYDFVLPT